MYPGWWDEGGDWVGTWVGYTGYQTGPSRTMVLRVQPVNDPTHGQMKAILVFIMRFPRMGLEWVLEWLQN